MTQPKHDKFGCHNKDTRWDRIRKRYTNNVSANLKSDAVKKFIEIDYIGRHQQNMINGDVNLDPVLVMDLRHEMFKKIPRKLPLATVAYSKNLQHCKDHNVSVEEHYIENQLNHFRKHLQKQNDRNRVPLKKLHSLLIDNTDIMNSLEITHKQIQDFYQTPLDALQQVHDLFADELKKHAKLVDDETLEERNINDLQSEHLPNDLERTTCHDVNEEAATVLGSEVEKNLENKEEEKSADFLIGGMNDFNVESEIFEVESQVDVDEQRTPSPLENTDELFQPTNIRLKFVRFDDGLNECQSTRETSTCSNTSDGIDSVVSDLAEEALIELQIEEENKLAGITEEKNLEISSSKRDFAFNRCSGHTCREENIEFSITGAGAPYDKSRLKQCAVITEINSNANTEEDNTANNEQSKIIKELFQPGLNNHTSLLRKYFLKWVHYTTIEKIEREHVDSRADRVKKINIFLDKLRIQKKRLQNNQNDAVTNKDHKKGESMENVKINKKYQNKIKVQQDIIDMQRLKLERQERIIMELKLHKLSEETNDARQELKNELKSVIRSGDPKSKAKAKCLQIIGNLKDEEDEMLYKLQGKSLLMPKFLQNMHERALERSVRHEQARQRRLQQEAEKEAQKLALEEAKRLEDEEAKRLRIEALKEKRRQEKMAKIIKERERQKCIENRRKAESFYKNILLKRIGMEGFKRLLQRKRDNLKKCEQLRRSLYKKTYFEAWFGLYRILKARRNKKADQLYEKCLKRKYIQTWLQFIHEERSKYNVAVDYNEYKLTGNMFHKWWLYVKQMQIVEESKMNQAISHHEWHLKWKVLDCWQRLPHILKLEKETEERRQRWRLKIWELLPDYTPHRDDFNYI